MSNRHQREIVIRDLQERFGYSSPGYVLRVIKKYDENPNELMIETRNKVLLFRELELHKVYEAHLDIVSAIESQIEELEGLRLEGERWWSSSMRVGVIADKETEMEERTSIDDRILYLRKELSRAYADHYHLLGDISPAEKRVDITAVFEFNPDKGLQEMLGRNNTQLIEGSSGEILEVI